MSVSAPHARAGSIPARVNPARLRQIFIGGLLACPLLLYLAAAFYYPLAYTLAESVTPEALQYVNRLSDYLFVAARYVNDKGAADLLWRPGENR